MKFTTDVAVNLEKLPPLVRVAYGDEAGVKSAVLCTEHAWTQLFQELQGLQLVSLEECLTHHLGRTATGRLYFRYQPVQKVEEAGEKEVCQICPAPK